MWGFNTNIDEVWVPDPVLFLNAEIIYFNQQKNQKKKENKKRKQLLKALKANENNLYESQFQIVNDTINSENLNEETSQFDYDESDKDESLTLNSVLGDFKFESQIQQNIPQVKQSSATNIGKSLFSQQGLQSLKNKGALQVQKFSSQQNSFITQNDSSIKISDSNQNKSQKFSYQSLESKNNYECIVKALHLENRNQRFEELKKIFQNNGGVNDQVQAQNKNSEQTISAQKSLLNDKVLFDLKISLVQRPKERLFITITDQQDLKTFLRQIKEVMEQKYQIFNGLTGFKVKTLEIDYLSIKNDQRAKAFSNIQQSDRIQSFFKQGRNDDQKLSAIPFQNSKSDLQDSNLSIPSFHINESIHISQEVKASLLQKVSEKSAAFLNKKSLKNQQNDQINYNLKIDINNQIWQEEVVKKFLRKNDRCFVRMESKDLWLNIDLLIEVQPRKFQSNFQMKVDMDMTGKQLKKVIQKMSISIWNQIAAENNLLDDQKYNKNDAFNGSLNQFQNLFLMKQRRESLVIKDEQLIFNQMIDQVHQLLKRDHLYVLTDIEITKEKSFKSQKSGPGVQASNYKKVANQQYRALVAQERELSKQKGKTSISTNMEEFLIDEDENSQTLQYRYIQQFIETQKDEEDEIVNIQIDDFQEIGSLFDYDRNKVRVNCHFQAIIDYFETYIKKINQKIKNIDALPTINQQIDAQENFASKEIQIQVEESNGKLENQAFKIINQNQLESVNPLALKPCNEEEIFLWNLANVSSSKIENLLYNKNQSIKLKKDLNSFSANQESNTIRSQYIQTLKTKDLFNNLILQKEQIQDNYFKKNSYNFSQIKTRNKSKRKSIFQDLFTSKIQQTDKIKQDSISDFDLSTSFNTLQNKTLIPRDIGDPFVFQKVNQLSKSQIQVQKYDSKRFSAIPSNQIQEPSIVDNKQNITNKTQDQLETQNSISIDDEIQLEVYNPKFIEDTRTMSLESVKSEQKDFSKRFLLQNRALNFILLQSKRELPNAQLFQRHLLIKNAIDLMNKTQNSSNFNAFKAMEMLIDHVNPQNHFLINKNDSNVSQDNHRNSSQSQALQKQSFNTSEINKKQSFKFSISSKLDLGSQDNINQTNQKLIEFQKSIQEEEEYESSSSSSSGKDQVRDYDCSDEEDKQTEKEQDDIIEEQEDKVSNRFQSTIQKLDNDNEWSRADTIIDYGERQNTLSQSAYNKRNNTIMQNQKIYRTSSTFYKSNDRKETEVDFLRSKSQFNQSIQRKGTEMNLGRQQSYISKFDGSDQSKQTQTQLNRQNSDFFQIKKDESNIETEINFLDKKNTIKSSKSQKKLQNKKKLQLNLEEDYMSQFELQIDQNSQENQTNTLKVNSNNDLKNNKLEAINEADESLEDNSKSKYLNFSQKEDSINQDQKKYNFINHPEIKNTPQNKFFKLFESWGYSNQKTFSKKVDKTIAENSTKMLFKTNQINNIPTPRSTTKNRTTDLSMAEINYCPNCGFEQPQKSQSSNLCLNCKGDFKQVKHFYNYFIKERPKINDGISLKTYLNANTLFDLPSVSFVNNDSLQVAINEGINNLKSHQLQEDKTSKVAQDLVKKAIFIGGGGNIHELSDQQVAVKNILNSRDFPKYNQAQQLIMFGFQMQLAMLVPLPECLLTYEEYLQIKEPMIINLEYHEIKGKIQKDDGQDIIIKREQKKYWLRNQSLKMQILIVGLFVVFSIIIAIIIAVYLLKIID